MNATNGHTGGYANGSAADDRKVENGAHDEGHVPFLTWRTFFMAILVSMGGLVFGYDTGQISGFLEMEDFLKRFADKHDPPKFSNVRSGLIVGMVGRKSARPLRFEILILLAFHRHTHRVRHLYS